MSKMPSAHQQTPITLTADQSFLKRINSMALVRLVKAQPGVSRADLAKQTGLTKSTVSLLAQELIDAGWLSESDVQVTNNVGRRPTPLSLDGNRLALLGAEIGVDYINVVVCNLRGELLTSRMMSYRHLDVDESVAQLCRVVVEVLEWLHAQGRKPLGLGVGVPGVMNASGELLRFAPNLGWHDVAITACIREKLAALNVKDLPLFVMNEANAAALSEYVFGLEYHTAPLVYLSIGVGLGAGIILGDRTYLGNDGLAGEVGHTTLHIDGPLCTCGRRGCAETFVSQRAVSMQLGSTDTILSMHELGRRVAQHDAATEAAIRNAGQYLGLLLQNLINLINPAVIVLGGPLCQFGDLLVHSAIESMERHSGRHDIHRTSIRTCGLGINACAVGAAGAVIHQFLYPLESASSVTG